MKKIYFQSFLLFVLTLTIFWQWFQIGLITGGDYWFNFPSMYSQYNIAGFAWSWVKGNGMGFNSTAYQAISFDFGFPIFVFGNIFRLPWSAISKIGFFYPFLIVSIFSSFYLHKKIFSKSTFWVSSVIIFLFNTYILTIVGGGQIIIGLTYAVFPFLLWSFMEGMSDEKKYFDKSRLRQIIVSGILFGITALLDLRFAYVALLGIFLYFAVDIAYEFSLKNLGKYVSSLVYGVILPLLLGGLLNGFWVVPFIVNRRDPLTGLGDAFNSLGSVKFFSFATFENSLSLLHPNWPENLFGKIYFMRPEFLLIPLIGFMSLYSLRRIKGKTKEKKYILFFILLALLGAFLSKGAQEPFGGAYLWMFVHVPGMEMFRDPTKFYMLTAIAYSILIPFVFYRLNVRLKSLIGNSTFITILFTLLWLLTIRQAVLHQLAGTFKSATVPSEYVSLEKKINSDPKFYRTFWVPVLQRYGFYSDTHPPITANDFLKSYSYSDIYKLMRQEKTKNLLENSAVGYVIVPYDSQGEIYMDDRRYSPKLYKEMVNNMQKIPWLKQDNNFKDIGVFQVSSFKDHFWSPSSKLKINYKNISPVEYNVNVQNATVGDVMIFSETFDPSWIINTHGVSQEMHSKPFEDRFNSFILTKSGDYEIKVYYAPQQYVNIGIAVSVIIGGLLLLLLFYTRKKGEGLERRAYIYKDIFDKKSQIFRYDLYERLGLKKLFLGKYILDLGCGYGPDALNFLDFAKSVTGVDILTHKEWKENTRKNLSFIRASSEKLPFKTATFDGVFLKDLLHHVKNPEITLHELHRVVKKEGKIVILEGNRYNPLFYLYATKVKKHEHFTQNELKKLVSHEFKKFEIIHIEAYPPYGMPEPLYRKLLMLERQITKIQLLHMFFSYNVVIITKK